MQGCWIDGTIWSNNCWYNKSREQLTPRPELDFRSEALAGPESRHKTAQPTQTPHHSLRTSDNAKPLVRKDRKEFELIEGRTRSVCGGCWGILIEKQLMDQQLSQAYRLLYITEARVQAPFELEPPHPSPTADSDQIPQNRHRCRLATRQSQCHDHHRPRN